MPYSAANSRGSNRSCTPSPSSPRTVVDRRSASARNPRRTTKRASVFGPLVGEPHGCLQDVVDGGDRIRIEVLVGSEQARHRLGRYRGHTLCLVVVSPHELL